MSLAPATSRSHSCLDHSTALIAAARNLSSQQPPDRAIVTSSLPLPNVNPTSHLDIDTRTPRTRQPPTPLHPTLPTTARHRLHPPPPPSSGQPAMLRLPSTRAIARVQLAAPRVPPPAVPGSPGRPFEPAIDAYLRIARLLRRHHPAPCFFQASCRPAPCFLQGPSQGSSVADRPQRCSYPRHACYADQGRRRPHRPQHSHACLQGSDLAAPVDHPARKGWHVAAAASPCCPQGGA